MAATRGAPAALLVSEKKKRHAHRKRAGIASIPPTNDAACVDDLAMPSGYGFQVEQSSGNDGGELGLPGGLRGDIDIANLGSGPPIDVSKPEEPFAGIEISS